MVTNSPPARHSAAAASWQQQLAEAIRDPVQLLAELGLEPALLGDAAAVARAQAQFPLRVPRAFVARMRRGDPRDPLLRQVLPLALEQAAVPGFGGDPLGEAAARRAPGLLQKYAGRALLMTTSACAVHCRYCFRRDHDYAQDQASGESGRWEQALARVAADPSIEELILSGGDPLSLGNARLAELVHRVQDMGHVKRLRLHTRTPIVLPARVDQGLLTLLSGAAAQVLVVVHANHAAEIDAEVAGALAALRGTGATLLNQSVLLAGVNDATEALAELSLRLFEAGTLPYYLHLLDPVGGVAHFDVSEARARQLLRELNARLPGYLVPRLVREIAGRPGKTPVSSS